MKKLLILVAITTISTASFAQANINKGDWMVGGDAGYKSAKNEYSGSTTSDAKLSTLNLSPNIGYFFINQLAGGLRLSLTSSTEKFGTPQKEDKYTSTLIGPFLRYYFLPATQKLNIFVDANYGFGSNKHTPPSGSSNKSDLSGYDINGGVAFFVNPAVAIEFTLGYQSLKDKYSSGSTSYTNDTKTFGFNIGFQIHLPGSKMGTSK